MVPRPLELPFKLKFAQHLSVVKVLLTNLLEDAVEELSVYQTEDAGSAVKLAFHGFEVKTVKLVLGKPGYVCCCSSGMRERY